MDQVGARQNSIPLDGPDVESRLRADALTLAYDKRVVVRDLDVQITDGSFTVIVGPNACGKSTFLRSLARVLKPQSGAVYLDGQTIASQPSKQVARQLGMLPQSSVAPGGIVGARVVVMSMRLVSASVITVAVSYCAWVRRANGW